MMDRVGFDHAERRRPHASLRRSLPLAVSVLVLLVLGCLLGAAVTAGAASAAKPGKPTAKTPKGTITITTPTFTWTKPSGPPGTKCASTRAASSCSRRPASPRPRGRRRRPCPRRRTSRGRCGPATPVAPAWSSSLAFKMAVSTTKAITAFSFQGLVTGRRRRHRPRRPHDRPDRALRDRRQRLVATFTTTGASVKVGSRPGERHDANDFTNPVTYTVTAADASTQDYVVTVTGRRAGDRPGIRRRQDRLRPEERRPRLCRGAAARPDLSQW